MTKVVENVKLETPVEYELKDYKEKLFDLDDDRQGGINTHEALMTKQAFSACKLYLRKDCYYKEDMWCEIYRETPKAILMDVDHRLEWIPKSLIKKVRKIREVTREEV